MKERYFGDSYDNYQRNINNNELYPHIYLNNNISGNKQGKYDLYNIFLLNNYPSNFNNSNYNSINETNNDELIQLQKLLKKQKEKTLKKRK